MACQPCSITLPGCINCLSSSGCLTCGDKYYRKSDMKCAACTTITDNCATCSRSGTTLTCNTCSNGFTLSSNTCIVTPAPVTPEAVKTFSSELAFASMSFLAALLL